MDNWIVKAGTLTSPSFVGPERVDVDVGPLRQELDVVTGDEVSGVGDDVVGAHRQNGRQQQDEAGGSSNNHREDRDSMAGQFFEAKILKPTWQILPSLNELWQHLLWRRDGRPDGLLLQLVPGVVAASTWLFTNLLLSVTKQFD